VTSQATFFLPYDCVFILWHFGKKIILILHFDIMGVF
jgi:hypothetical protein